MRTLKGYQALDVAAEYQLDLYDQSEGRHVTLEEARAKISQRVDPDRFVLRNWPDSDREAEEVVLQLFELALAERQLLDARVEDLASELTADNPLHLQAAVSAAERLADRGALEVVSGRREDPVYRLPATVYLTDAFLDQLRSVVCEDCADLDLAGPFHKSCLASLIQFLQDGNFRLRDVTEVRADDGASRFQLGGSRRVPGQLLAKTVTEAKSRWQSVVKPMLQRTRDAQSRGAEASTTRWREDASPHTAPDASPGGALGRSAERPRPATAETGTWYPEDVAAAGNGAGASDSGTPNRADWTTGRQRVTKEQLISYLAEIEIIDESGEISALRRERTALSQKIAERERDLLRLEREKAFLERQCEEMKRDLDTLVEAMQIAKRRSRTETTVVDVDEP
ncbi:MAG: hypothetical protein K6T78_14890 [Alicyclobacillus sp.]|nr:hypothetical protein [Alicyclobacillus sp.]